MATRADPFQLSRKTPVAFLFAESKADREHLAAKLIPLATATKGQMVWAVVNPSKHIERASQLGLEPGPWPAFAIDDGGSGFQYAHSSRGSVSRLGKEIGEVVQKYFRSISEVFLKMAADFCFD